MGVVQLSLGLQVVFGVFVVLTSTNVNLLIFWTNVCVLCILTNHPATRLALSAMRHTWAFLATPHNYIIHPTRISGQQDGYMSCRRPLVPAVQVWGDGHRRVAVGRRRAVRAVGAGRRRVGAGRRRVGHGRQVVRRQVVRRRRVAGRRRRVAVRWRPVAVVRLGSSARVA